MYRVQLKNFEGPLDLLLFFIKRDELDIYNIPISHITKEFLEYIRVMEELDLDVASEFILMASMLMSIKAQMMLPNKTSENEIDENDPRYALVQRLLQYKRYKEMGGKLHRLAKNAHLHHYRGTNKADQVKKQATGEALQDVTMFDLMAAFKKVLADIKKQEAVHRVKKIEATIEEQTIFVQKFLSEKGQSSFAEICASIHTYVKVVVTFLAILEMLKERRLALFMENDDPTAFYVDIKYVGEALKEQPAGE